MCCINTTETAKTEDRKEIIMKKQLKKTVSLGLAAVMALGLTACGGGSSSSDSTTAAAGSGETKTEAAADSGNSGDVKVIKLFHRFPDDPCNSFIESKLAEYESLHPDIKFEVTSAQNQPYKEKIKVVVGSDECPDIFFSFCGEFSERFIREGLLLDLTPYMEADPDWKASLMETQMNEYTTEDGMVYGIPFRLDAKEFFYNKDIFNELGLEVPETWDQFIEVLDKIKASGMDPIAEGNQDKCELISALDEHLAELRQQREADLSAAQEAAFALDNGNTLFIQTCDSGYDYTLYGPDHTALDGGQLDAPGLTLPDAGQEALNLLGQTVKVSEVLLGDRGGEYTLII